MDTKLERAVIINMANVAVIGAIQSAMLRTLVAQKLLTRETWDCLFNQAEETLRAQVAERPYEREMAIDALRRVRNRERPGA